MPHCTPILQAKTIYYDRARGVAGSCQLPRLSPFVVSLHFQHHRQLQLGSEMFKTIDYFQLITKKDE